MSDKPKVLYIKLARTPEQREAGEYVAIDTMDPEVRSVLDAQDNAFEEQDATIDKLRKDVDRWIDDLEKRGDETSDNEMAIKALQATVAEQSAIITGQRAAIEELRGWIQERADGVSNLGMRVAKLEDGGCNASKVRDDVLRHQIAATRVQAEKDRIWTRDLIATWRKELGGRIDKAEAALESQGQFMVTNGESITGTEDVLNDHHDKIHRLLAAMPSAAKPPEGQILITRQGLDELKTTAREGNDE